MAEERQGWYPGKFAKGLLGKIKDHHAKFQEGGEYGTRTGAQQAQIAFDRAEGAANEGGVGQGDSALERISQAANMGQSMDFARDFDPANAESVREMQRNLNRAGYKDKYGNALDEDGKMGGLTESALRTAQADRTPESRYEARGSMGISGDLADPEMARMNLRGAAPTTEPGGQPIIGGESEGGWMQKLQDWGMIKDRPAPQQQSAGPGGRMGAYSRPRGGGGRNY